MEIGETNRTHIEPHLRVLHEQWQRLLEVCHYTENLNPIWHTRQIQQQLKSLSIPLIQEAISEQNDAAKFELIRKYFFEDLGFEILERCNLDLQTCFIPYTLKSRRGPAPLIMLLFCCLLEECGIDNQVTCCRKKYLLKVHINGKANIIDFLKNGHFLQPHDIVELINKGFDFSNGSLDGNCLVVEYLNIVKYLSKKHEKLNILSMTHSYLMKYQPFNLKHISERAVVAYETGDYKSAIEDIRSYFQYKQANFTNIQLKKIYKKALRNL